MATPTFCRKPPQRDGAEIGLLRIPLPSRVDTGILVTGEHSVIRSNLIDNSTDYGIRVASGHNTSIQQNKISNCTGYGLGLSATTANTTVRENDSSTIVPTHRSSMTVKTIRSSIITTTTGLALMRMETILSTFHTLLTGKRTARTCIHSSI